LQLKLRKILKVGRITLENINYFDNFTVSLNYLDLKVEEQIFKMLQKLQKVLEPTEDQEEVLYADEELN